MKKILILNGGPRKNNNTAKLLASAREGAASAGASVETIDLYNLNFTDCRSCLACKNKKIALEMLLEGRPDGNAGESL